MLARSAFRPRKQNAGRPAHKSARGFLQWLRGRPCAIEARGGCEGRIEAMHVDYAGDKGMGTKVSDKFSIPCCSEHHRLQHAWGWQTWEANFKFNALLAAKAYWEAWPGRRMWEQANG